MWEPENHADAYQWPVALPLRYTDAICERTALGFEPKGPAYPWLPTLMTRTCLKPLSHAAAHRDKIHDCLYDASNMRPRPPISVNIRKHGDSQTVFQLMMLGIALLFIAAAQITT